MTTLRTLKKLLFGETWTIPLGLAAVVLLAALVLKPLLGHAWHHIGGFTILAGALIVLAAAIARPR